mgnify:CR=1 FL=1
MRVRNRARMRVVPRKVRPFVPKCGARGLYPLKPQVPGALKGKLPPVPLGQEAVLLRAAWFARERPARAGRRPSVTGV